MYKYCLLSRKDNQRLAVFTLLLLCFYVLTTQAILAEDDDSVLREQRKQYLAAKKSLRAGHFKTYRKIAKELKDYPLYPYLRYDYLRRRLWKVRTDDIVEFLETYHDLPMANDLRKSWLRLLVKRGHWQTFVDNYTPQADESLQCYHLVARMKTANQAYLLEDIRSTWLAGESLPPECDPAFALLYRSELLTDELVWQRIRLAMENNKTGLATYLARKLQPEKLAWANQWLAMHASPSRHTRNVSLDDVPEAREILLHGIHRLARQDINRAVERWSALKTRYSFDTNEVSTIDQAIAARAARKKHKLAKQLLSDIDNKSVDEKLMHLRLATALADYDWDLVLQWTEGTPGDESIRLRWYYWRARALEQAGRDSEAKDIFDWLSRERDYYGFLAADRIGAPYQMNYHPLPEDPDEWQKLSQLPGFLRARELYHIGSHYSARREWHHVLKHLTSYQKQIAATIAANWGWHDRAILTLARAEIYDDLVTRFPMPFNDTMLQFAKMRDLDIAWLYALTRAESAFIEDVRSPAGALGLMQVMPATGLMTAKNIGLRNYRTAQLLTANKNVRLGSAYLKQMYKAFNDNVVLATAAYNAGPANVKRWLPKTQCEEADIWIEKIPFTETRKYVRRILFFTSVYDWRLKREIIPIKERTTLIQPKKQIVAGKSCPVNKA